MDHYKAYQRAMSSRCAMRYPSVKTLARLTDKARELRKVLDGSRDPLSYHQTARWANECYDPPETMELRMHAANVILEGYGVEGVCVRDSFTRGMSYVNMGDTYKLTLLLTPEGRFVVTSWGDYIERNEGRFE